jgi:integrase
MGVKVKEWKGAHWLVVVHKGKRKRKRVGTGRAGKKAAELAATKIAAKLAEGDLSVFDTPKPTGPALTFATVAEEWLRKYPLLHAVRPSTMDNYRSFTDRHLLPFFGNRPISGITPELIEDFIEAKRSPGGSVGRPGKPLSDASLRTGLLALRLILQRAVKTKLIPGNPMKEVEFRLAPRIDQVDPFTGPELRALLNAAGAIDADFATLFRLWAQTGMRAGEICGLQWQDVDLERGTALVQRTWSRQRLGPTKTGHARTVSLVHPVADESPDWRAGVTDAGRSVLAGLRGLTMRSLVPEAFVFGRSTIPLSSMELHRRWRRVLAKARVRYRVPEQLRHTFASTMLSRNAPLLYVQQQGGWRSASVLLRVYARWMPQEAGIAHPSATLLPPTPATVPVLGAPDRP